MKAVLIEKLVAGGADESAAGQLAADLLAWYNRATPDAADVELLAALFLAGRFHSWKCPTCDSRVYKGRPEDWGKFQGVHQVDYVSYPGPRRQCDPCRFHMVPYPKRARRCRRN